MKLINISFLSLLSSLYSNTILKHQKVSKTSMTCCTLWGCRHVASKDESPFPLFVRLCSDRAAFEARTQRRLSLNMDEVKRALEESEGHEIVVYTPHMLVLKSGKAEITLSRDGRMLIKRVSNEAEAAQVARQILRTILKRVFIP